MCSGGTGERVAPRRWAIGAALAAWSVALLAMGPIESAVLPALLVGVLAVAFARGSAA